MSEPATPKVPVHPVLAKLAEGGTPPASPPQAPVKLSGYVGPASQPGLVRLYSAIGGSHYAEFPEDAVIHTASTPETVMPDGATTLWIRNDTPVRFIKEFSTASALVTAVTNMVRRRGLLAMHAAASAQRRRQWPWS
ncbi:hypothetical protein M2432_003745 [Mycobacterium sp. OTB74]|nr:hypothetical protein [Mycobacterium sp. OTB74]